MPVFRVASALAAVLVGLVVATTPPPARADIGEYEFQLVEQQIKVGDGVVVRARLVHKSTGKPVEDAIVFARRIDMEPEDMPTMTSPLEPVPSEEPGIYQFRTNLIMEGGWRLSLAAKVQGETGTVESRLVLQAVP